MARSRYQFSETKNNDNNDRVYRTTLLPDLTDNQNDIFIETEVGQRLDSLANQYYNDPTLWWVIAKANNINNGSIQVEAGVRLRIPQNRDR